MSALINQVDIMKPRILIVDNEINTQKQLRHPLELANFSVKCIQDGSDAINYILETIPDVILFDVVLPTMDGLELYRIMSRHHRTRHIPTVILSEQASVEDRIVALELGVDDYIEKPFTAREVVLRCRAVHRRSNGFLNQLVEEKIFLDQLKIDSSKRQVFCAGDEVSLTKTEFNLLICLVKSPNRVFARETLLEQILPPDTPRSSRRTVDTHINRLRHKLGAEGKHIQTVHGIGYRYQ
tara:strand:+ start:6056 stop:6772 length:717 start_codon:yes stop_codon:yes gene_type:complete